MDPEAVVQAQLDAYNAHDVDALVAIYADDAEHYAHPSTLVAKGSAQLRERFAARFQDPSVRARLRHRVVAAPFVVDVETVSRRFPEGPGEQELVATYEVAAGRIVRAWFVFGPPRHE